MSKLTSLNAVYVEVAFLCATVAGVLGVVTETLTGYPGDLVGQDTLVVAGIVQAGLSLVAAALLKRAT